MKTGASEYLVQPDQANDALTGLSNSAVSEDPAAVHTFPAGLVVSGALAFQSNAAETQVAGRVFPQRPLLHSQASRSV